MVDKAHDELDRPGTVIVGAGVSGLACARTLFDAGGDFVVVSENIGGRVLQSADGAVPLGAFYVRADYEHVNRFVSRGRRIRSRDTVRHDEQGAYGRWDRRLFAHPIQAARFLVLLWRFRRHYRRFKKNCLSMSQPEAIAADGFLDRFYHQPATATVEEYRFDDVARAYVAPGLHGTAFVPLERLSGFMMLLGSLPVIEPIHEFTMRWSDLLSGFGQELIEGTVQRIVDTGRGFRVETVDGRAWLADHVVVATDPARAQRLVGLERVKEPVAVHMYEIDGALRPGWADARMHLFSDDQPILAILQRPGGLTLVATEEPDPVLDRHFTRSAVLEHHWWEPAFNLIGDALVECEQAPNLYVIGDHNVCGLEDAFITGVYAAKQIMRHGDLGLYNSCP